MIIAENKGGNYKIIPAGVYPARCISMIEFGTQDIEYLGEIKRVRQVNVTWELPTELAVFHEEKGEEPFVVSKTYTLSLHEKSGLRKDLESWRGQGFTEEEAKRFDITKLLGKPCQISIIHKKSADGTKTYANISSITPLMKGVVVPEQINPTKILSFDKFDWDVFKNLPDWLKDKIIKSDEYKAIAGYEPNHQDVADEVEETTDLPF